MLGKLRSRQVGDKILCILILWAQVHMDFASPSSSRSGAFYKNPKRGWSANDVESVDPGDAVKMESSKPEDDPTETVLPKKWLQLETSLASSNEVTQNADLTLECVAVGSPPPLIYWLKNGKPVENVAPFDMEKVGNQVLLGRGRQDSPSVGFTMAKLKSKLPLRCIRPEDQGEYSCVADNEARQIISSTSVTVKEAGGSEVRPECEQFYASPSFPYRKKSRSKGFPGFVMSYESLHMETIGSDVSLPCGGAGRPRPQTTWLDPQGNKIINDKKYQITSRGSLVIRQIGWSDMGEYTCSVRNNYGTEDAGTFLYPLLAETS